MSKRNLGLTAALVLCTGALATLPATPAHAEVGHLKCHLTYNLAGWAAIYQHATGSGHITCDDGQRAAVTISVHGGGLTAGKYRVSGRGDISGVHNISEVFGDYVQAGASAGAVHSGTAQVLTKGTASIALTGTGEGWNLGVAVDGFSIQPVK